MELFNIPAFGENCIENRTNSSARVFVISNVGGEVFDSYRRLLEESGFINKEEYAIGAHRFAVDIDEIAHGLKGVKGDSQW